MTKVLGQLLGRSSRRSECIFLCMRAIPGFYLVRFYGE
jgi:hypothetical protein